MTWVYLKSEPTLWTVGFYDPAGAWRPGADFGSEDEAAARTAWLNGIGEADRRTRRWDPGQAARDPDATCILCSGSINDHVEVVGEGPHGEETHGYRCLINELSDVIHDIETSIATDGENIEVGDTEERWVATLKLVEAAYRGHLSRG